MRPREWLALATILSLAGLLRLWRLDQNGLGNGYYAAAVRSMLVSTSNFFFGAFDPTGFITVDKPPGAIWLQAVSAKIFGYHGLSLLLPQALMGAATAGVVFLQIRRVFGAASGLLAASVLALTPIGVAVDRDNLPDTLLTLLLVLAAGALLRSFESSSWKRLVWSMVLVGAAFNVKMLAAFVVLPTFYLAYLLFAPCGWRMSLIRLTAASGVLACISLSWSVVVELTPPNRRPYIGGSRTNSALELALGYNGLGRVFGGLGNMGPPGGRGRMFRPPADGSTSSQQPDQSGPPPNGPNGPLIAGNLDRGPFGGDGGWPSPGGFGPPMDGGPDGFPGGPDQRMRGPRSGREDRRGRFGGPPGGGFGGTPGVLRFFNPTLAEQITWLFPLAFLGAYAGCRYLDRGVPLKLQRATVVIWAGWLVTHLVLFSFAQGIFHEYYTVVMGPAVAALVGIGVPALWRSYQSDARGQTLLPTALIGTGVWQACVLGQHAELRYSLLPLSLGGMCLGAAVLLFGRNGTGNWARRVYRPGGLVLGISAAMLAPAAWSVSTMLSPGFSLIPVSSSSWLTGSSERRPSIPGPGEEELSMARVARLVDFLRSRRDGETYLVAGASSMQVQSIIIHTGEPAIALGGFLGADPVLTKEQFIELVDNGKLRFVLVGGGPGPGGRTPFRPMDGPFPGGPPDFGSRGLPLPGGPGGPLAQANGEIMEWVREHGEVVDASLWQAEDVSVDGPRPFGGPGPRTGELYDLKPAMRQLADRHSR